MRRPYEKQNSHFSNDKNKKNSIRIKDESIKKIIEDNKLANKKKSKENKKTIFIFNQKQWTLFLFVGFFFTALGNYLVLDGEISFPNIELGIFSKIHAEKTSQQQLPGEEKITLTQPNEKNGNQIENKTENSSYLSHLNEKKHELDERENKIKKMENELQERQKELAKKVEELGKMREGISKSLGERVEGDKEKLNKLVDFYANMTAKKAAEIMGSMNEDLVVSILENMKKKNAAEILNLMESKKAQMLTEKFAGYKGSP